EDARTLIDGEFAGQIRIGGNDFAGEHSGTRSQSSQLHLIAEASQLSRPLRNTRIGDKGSSALFAPDVSSSRKCFQRFPNGDFTHIVARRNQILVRKPVVNSQFAML